MKHENKKNDKNFINTEIKKNLVFYRYIHTKKKTYTLIEYKKNHV